MGNLHSLRKALALHADVEVAQDAASLADAEAIVLPGVGAFAPVMERLAPAAPALRAHHAAGKPLVGVCIGMQALYEGSDEAPGTPGLGILAGNVSRLDPKGGKIPHMGWNTLAPHAPSPMQRMPQEAMPEGAQRIEPRPASAPTELSEALARAGHVYYVHSYAAPVGPGTLATTRYGSTFAAVVQDGRTIGFQFHPEKSGHAGKAILGAALRALEDT